MDKKYYDSIRSKLDGKQINIVYGELNELSDVWMDWMSYNKFKSLFNNPSFYYYYNPDCPFDNKEDVEVCVEYRKKHKYLVLYRVVGLVKDEDNDTYRGLLHADCVIETENNTDMSDVYIDKLKKYAKLLKECGYTDEKIKGLI